MKNEPGPTPRRAFSNKTPMNIHSYLRHGVLSGFVFQRRSPGDTTLIDSRQSNNVSVRLARYHTIGLQLVVRIKGSAPNAKTTNFENWSRSYIALQDNRDSQCASTTDNDTGWNQSPTSYRQHADPPHGKGVSAHQKTKKTAKLPN